MWKKSKFMLKNGSEGKLMIRGHQMWRMGSVATRWWISKESYDQNLYSGYIVYYCVINKYNTIINI